MKTNLKSPSRMQRTEENKGREIKLNLQIIEISKNETETNKTKAKTSKA